ncbi:hypothetical protein [Microbacterium sp. B19]|uniref:hypothetical protein n=1 Tax=Microbacterium sp. B19 TaxID=96765 RepID=UPI0003B6968A|nr:hypothetical protein [Microbacterium sp. B19]
MNDELTPSERAAMRSRILGGARDIKPVGAHRNAWIAGSVAAVLVAAIAGGVVATSTLSAPQIANTPSPTATTEPVVPTPTPTPTPSAMPTPPPHVVTQPASRFSFGCDDVARTVRGFFGGEVPETALALPRPRGNFMIPGPAQYAFAQAGDVYCEFGEIGGTNLTVAVVADGQGVIEDRNSFTSGTCDPAYPPCELVAGTFIWVDGDYDGQPPDAARSAVNAAWGEMRDLVLASPPGPSSWVPPTGTTPLTGDCTTFLRADRLSAILGNGGMEIKSGGRGGWSLEYWMLFGQWEAPPCFADSTDPISSFEDPAGMSFVWLPGGEWAFDVGATGDAVPFERARGSDRAVFSCGVNTGVEVCHIDLLVDGTWIRFSLPEIVAPADRMTVGSEIASAIAERVYG